MPWPGQRVLAAPPARFISPVFRSRWPSSPSWPQGCLRYTGVSRSFWAGTSRPPARPCSGSGTWAGGATPLILLALWLCITTMTFTVLGPGIGTLISLAFPWHIGSAASGGRRTMAGNAGIAGLVLIPAMLFGLCARRRAWRVATLISAAAISSCAWMTWEPIKAARITRG